LATTEATLQFALPALLRRVYLEVANGGFGPGYGVMGVDGGFTDDRGQTISDAWATYRRAEPGDDAWLWPVTFVPFCYWGCTVYSVVDCAAAGTPVHWVDVGDEALIVKPHSATLEAWLLAWLDGQDLWKQQ
jgi:hypothetical protein